MRNIQEVKNLEVTATPILLFDCELPSGRIEKWSTHDVQDYRGRVVQHNLFELKTGSDDGIDSLSKVVLTLANVDAYFSQIERQGGFKGARLTACFLFVDTVTGTPDTNAEVVFKGIANAPEEMSETTMRLSFLSRLSMQRTLLPPVRIQRRCPWRFPSNAAERAEAVDGGAEERYSEFYRCGYSPDAGGPGALDGSVPFTSCNYSRTDCQQRGMFSAGAARFGGMDFVPSSILVKSYGDRAQHLSVPVENEARYNDFVPIVYGTAWYRPPVIFARNDGNLTHLEVLLGMGPIHDVLKVVANGIELPHGVEGRNMTGTGWYNVVSAGRRQGEFNLDFSDGDPHGSMAVLSVVLPNRIANGSSLPRIEVLLQGCELPTYAEDGTPSNESFTNNPAWILLDVLRRCGWKTSELNLKSFARIASFCGETVQVPDLNGIPTPVPRYQCNLVLTKRRSAADLIRGIRGGSNLSLVYGSEGLLELRMEDTIAAQQPVQTAGGNSIESLDGGWPVYEFSEGSIVRKDNGDPSIRLFSRSTADTPNRFTVEFQDEFNAYQQDSLSLVDFDDAARTGQEISLALPALGLPNFNQAGRIARLQLDRSIRGNLYAEFETGLVGTGLRPGDLITITYPREGLLRQPFRIVKISPDTNYRRTRIVAQIHDDQWYQHLEDAVGGGRQPAFDVGLPRPLMPSHRDASGDLAFEVGESGASAEAPVISLSVPFLEPPRPVRNGPRSPAVHLIPDVNSSGGTLHGGTVLYYAISAIDSSGRESELSFVVRAVLPSTTDTNSVTIKGFNFDSKTTAFHVYRGETPSELVRIAESQPLGATYTDPGDEPLLAAPPDRNFDHANFYWRFELQPEAQATIRSVNTIGSELLQMVVNSYRGKTVRITSGKGKHQERVIVSNSEFVLNVSPDWNIMPDSTSAFAISESAWQFGALTASSPAVFDVPNRDGATVQVCGRSANVHDIESAYELSTVSRHVLSGATGSYDTGVPPQPIFGIGAVGQGSIEVGGIGFPTFENTRSITAGTLTLHYFDEVTGGRNTLDGSLSELDMTVALAQPATFQVGNIIQVEDELLRIERVDGAGLSYEVTRGVLGSLAAMHPVGTNVFQLDKRVSVLPFVRGFFGSFASGNYNYTDQLPHARIAAAQFYVTNSVGSSPSRTYCYTNTVDSGLRTYSGGQYTLQVDGFLAIQQQAVPPIRVEQSTSVRDIVAIVGQPSTGMPIEVQVTVNGAPYANLTIPASFTTSAFVHGLTIPPLSVDSVLGLNILSVAQTADTLPGRDLSVLIRL